MILGGNEKIRSIWGFYYKEVLLFLLFLSYKNITKKSHAIIYIFNNQNFTESLIEFEKLLLIKDLIEKPILMYLLMMLIIIIIIINNHRIINQYNKTNEFGILVIN